MPLTEEEKKQHRKQAERSYYLRNCDKLCAYSRAYKRQHPDKVKQWAENAKQRRKQHGADSENTGNC